MEPFPAAIESKSSESFIEIGRSTIISIKLNLFLNGACIRFFNFIFYKRKNSFLHKYQSVMDWALFKSWSSTRESVRSTNPEAERPPKFTLVRRTPTPHLSSVGGHRQWWIVCPMKEPPAH